MLLLADPFGPVEQMMSGALATHHRCQQPGDLEHFRTTSQQIYGWLLMISDGQ